ncbi:MAG: TetR/AcrR family transcriptional regulator [Ktedonobacteraceae bacterium]
MARAFSQEEKVHLQQRLLEVGQTLFLSQGLKKTSIEDLTRPLGIAKSSFYLFFASKEDLYLELLMQERARLDQQVMAASFEATADMCEAITRFIQVVIHEMERSELTRRLMTHPEEFALLTRQGSSQLLAANIQDSLARIRPFIEHGQETGHIIDASPDTIVGVLLAVIRLLTFHKETIGHDAYPAVRDLLINLVASALTRDAYLVH